MKVVHAVAVPIVAAGLSVGCGSSEKPPEQKHPLAAQACSQFQETLSDAETLTITEIRGHLKKVHEKGKFSESEDIRYGSKTMLTQITDTGIIDEPVIQIFVDACSELGFPVSKD